MRAAVRCIFGRRDGQGPCSGKGFQKGRVGSRHSVCPLYRGADRRPCRRLCRDGYKVLSSSSENGSAVFTSLLSVTGWWPGRVVDTVCVRNRSFSQLANGELVEGKLTAPQSKSKNLVLEVIDLSAPLTWLIVPHVETEFLMLRGPSLAF